MSALADVRSPGWAAGVAETSAVVLLLHGYGSNENDLAGLVTALGLTLPWASLRAPLELGNGGAAWFTITTPGNPDAEPVAVATDSIWAWVDANVASTTSVIPIGFSQGGLMASQLLRTRPARVLAPIVLGGFVLGADQPGDAALSANRPPVFWGRGTEDRVIGEPAIARTTAFLPTHSTLVERTYPGLAHGINAAEIDDVRSFLALNAGAESVNGR
ncbi:phospholipase [Cryobacterium sp. SO2]|uniref:alpha/beta hydrolase n=1 Tax=Cryobacterium sp. SO2 TaxID=1897060 RepID=UPI00223E4E2E|nr:phospholipase [Cryobacterium sp. SO2]WEO77202.1 phospholipase [Cryobacterium sp. SO2]